MDQLNPQTMLIVVGGIFLLLVFSLVRGVLRRKPKKSRSRKKQRTTKRTSSRRSPPKGSRPTRPLADEMLDMAERAHVKPARSADREVGRVVKVSPSAAIPLAWGTVEQGIERAAERVGAEPDELDSTVDMLRYLEAESNLSHDHARLFHIMRQLRNRAAHGELSKDEVDVAGAQMYGKLARSLTDLLDKLR
jgi:hypothetical protein